jgi:hypothetical protein
MYENFIGGKWVAPVKGKYFVDHSPINGEPSGDTIPPYSGMKAHSTDNGGSFRDYFRSPSDRRCESQ